MSINLQPCKLFNLTRASVVPITIRHCRRAWLFTTKVYIFRIKMWMHTSNDIYFINLDQSGAAFTCGILSVSFYPRFSTLEAAPGSLDIHHSFGAWDEIHWLPGRLSRCRYSTPSARTIMVKVCRRFASESMIKPRIYHLSEICINLPQTLILLSVKMRPYQVYACLLPVAGTISRTIYKYSLINVRGITIDVGVATWGGRTYSEEASFICDSAVDLTKFVFLMLSY